MNNGEQIEKMDVETETRSGRKLEGQLDQAGKDKTGDRDYDSTLLPILFWELFQDK